jgi:hypothetical protein
MTGESTRKNQITISRHGRVPERSSLLRFAGPPFLDAFRSDPEIDRLLFGFYGR